jgi:hypothetical protein
LNSWAVALTEAEPPPLFGLIPEEAQCWDDGLTLKVTKHSNKTISTTGVKPMTFIEKAVEIYGSQAKLAQRIGVSQASISLARKRGVSRQLAVKIVRDSNGLLDMPVSEWITASARK